ncbi:MAG: hypothetical protein WAO20_05945 [Acidobacteriota bacterium]
MRVRLTLSLLSILFVAPLFAQEPPTQPTIVGLFYSAQARIMGSVGLEVIANGGGRSLVYEWTILNDPTGACELTNPTSPRPTLEVWKNPQNESQGLGEQVQAQVTVSFADAVDGVDVPSQSTAVITLSSVNHPPVPVIGGNRGTLADPIRAGQVVQLNSFDSTDGDGGTNVRAEWGLGTKVGGYYTPIGPALFGTEGTIFAFTVPDMTAAIQQRVILALIDGLYMETVDAIVYLAPAIPGGGSGGTGGGTTNYPPTVTVDQTTVTVTKGQTAVIQASATDPNGDTLAFTWLMGSTTANTQYISTQQAGSTWVSTLNLPTASLAAGSYSMSVRATETSTTAHLPSSTKFVTLIVVDSGSGQPGFFNLTPGVCNVGGDTGPTLVSIAPDPRISEILLVGGQTASIQLLFQDQSQKESIYGVQTGVSDISWNLSQLTQRGISVSPPPLQATSNIQQARSTLTFQVPSASTGEAQVTATATDVVGCSTSVTFGLVFAAANNTAPTARIRYDHDGDSVFSGPSADGTTVGTSQRSIALDAGQSQDDNGPAQLNYTWSVSGISGASLTSNTGAQTTLLIPDAATGTATVTLVATDGGGLSGSSTIRFTIVAEGASPTAKIQYDDSGGGSFNGPFSSGHVVPTLKRSITLDGNLSEDDGGVNNLTFNWSVSGISGAALSSSTAHQTVLTVPGGTQGTVTVTLTVTDAQSLSDSTNIVFNYTSSGEPPTAEIIRSPEIVTSGDEFEVEAKATSNGGTGQFTYSWTATSGGDSVPVFQSASLARLVAPELAEGQDSGAVDIQLTVSEDGAPSEPVDLSIPLRGPRLFFAQVAVGAIDATRRLETAVALVNNADSAANATLTFINNPMGEDWTVQIGGEQVSDYEVNIPAGGARQLVVTGQDVQFGWMRLSSNVQLTGHLLYRVLQSGQSGSDSVLAEVPILPVSGSKFRTVLDPGSNEDVALAIVNVGTADAQFKLTAYGDGEEVISTKKIPLAQGEQLTKFLGEIFTEYGAAYPLPLPDTFSGGTLVVEAVDPGAQFVATLIRTKDGLPLSILPVATTK